MFAIAHRIVKDIQAAEDVTQNSVMRALRFHHEFKNNCPLKNWLGTITANESYNHLRRYRRQFEDIDLRLIPAPDIEDDPDSEIKDRIRIEVGRLSGKQKEVIVMRVYGGLTIREISKILGCNYNTVKANYRHGLKRLRARLTDQSLSLPSR